MSATRNHTERLATTQIFRESVRVKSGALTQRLREADRIDQFIGLWSTARRKPDWMYEFTRGEQRRRHPAELERSLIHDGIRSGDITREALIDYRAAQLQDDLTVFGGAVTVDHALYVAFMTETAEAQEATAIARGMPTSDTVTQAVREIGEAIAVAEIQRATLVRTAPL